MFKSYYVAEVVDMLFKKSVLCVCRAAVKIDTDFKAL